MKTDSTRHWFVLVNGKRHGPYTFATLTKAAKKGVVTAETNVWRRGWQKWHPARQVPGLLNEAPLAPDGAEWTEGDLRSVDEEALIYAPQRRSMRPSPDLATLPSEDKTDYIFADEWRMLAEQPPRGRGRFALSSRFGRRRTSADADGGGRDFPEYRAAARTRTTDGKPAPGGVGRFVRRVATAVFVILLLWLGWVKLGQPWLRQWAQAKPPTRSLVAPSAGELPASVASLPAVVALQRNDPTAFERFKKRYAESASGARDEEVLSIARAALRKSVKHLLAISSADVLLDITEASLAYMQALQASNPESCVALSDESKGAKLTSNLAKELPVQFVRDMSVLERIAGTNPHTSVAPMTADEARPHLEAVFTTLRRQAVRAELLGRDKLEPVEFQPYCELVIAFYKAVLELARDDKVNLLRYLYAAAAANADTDLAK